MKRSHTTIIAAMANVLSLTEGVAGNEPALQTVPRNYTLAIAYEDDFFHQVDLTREHAFAIVAVHMPRAACIKAMRLANNNSGLTFCIKED